ncbi:MAG: hypothetical protein WB566_10755 [Terriglobales bacterium]
MAGVCALLLAMAVAGQAQLTPPSGITVAPTNPIISTSQTQQFTAVASPIIDLQGVIQVSSQADASHTCALLANGTVECWGSNSFGELGNGSTTNSDVPVAVSGLSGVTAIAVGGDHHTCAVLAGGTVECWGYNGEGQLGNNSTTSSLVPVAVSNLSGVTAITAGADHSCALLANGTVECWGNNGDGQLGNGSTTESNVPVAVSNLGGATAIAAGGDHTCALLSNGTVECWGFNSAGQLGNGSNTESNVPVAVSNLSGATAIAAGGSHSCALLANGTAECWGYGAFGQLGNGNTSDLPVAVSNLSGAAGIAAGGYHTCALLANGTVQCWGVNDVGELGNDNLAVTQSSTPLTVIGNVVPGAGVKHLASGDSHTCALISDGTVQCWGYNGAGQLGNGSLNSSSTPVAVAGLSGPAIAIATGYQHSCALLAGGTMQCWGGDPNGELGNGTSGTDSTTPVTVQAVGGGGTLTGVTAIAAGLFHTCALLENGSVACWGYNLAGELGNGGVSSSTVPVAATALNGLGPVKAIAAGGYHTCVLLPDGQVYCLGDDDVGQLGNYATGVGPFLTPQVVNLQPFNGVGTSTITATAITAASDVTCALIADGSAQCWGYNFYGQLGDNSYAPFSDVPAVVSGLSGATGISAGGLAASDHTCAVLATGAADCWGDNAIYELGNNSENNSNVPVTVSLAQNIAKAIAPQQFATCALLADGTVQCWGTDYTGQLGNGAGPIPGAPASSLPVPTVALVPMLSWTSGTTTVAAIGSESGLATPYSLASIGTTLIMANYSLPTALTASTTLTVGLPPVLMTSPGNETVAAGTTATFTAAIEPGAYPTPTVQWQMSSGGAFSNILNANSDTLSFTAMTSENGYQYQAVFSNGLGTVTAGPATLTVTTPAMIGKSFSPTSIPVNGTSTLTFTLTNTNASVGLTSLSFSDTFPSGMQVASPLSVTNGCGGMLTAMAGATSVSLSGGSVGSGVGTFCTLAVVVRGTTAGQLTNTASTLSSSGGTSASGASASLTVVAPPTISKAFGASGIVTSGTTTLTFTLTNPSANSVAETGVAFTDTLTGGLQVASTPGVTTTCGGSFSNATSGSTSLSFSGGSIPISSSCTVSVNITSTSTGVKTNVTGAVSSSNGGAGTTSNTATLTVDQAPHVTGLNYATFTKGVTGSFTVTTTGYPVPSLSFSPAGSLPAGVMFVDNRNGMATISGKPTVSGTFTFWIGATNGISPQGLESFTLTVKP